jgi:hypothetical protein
VEEQVALERGTLPKDLKLFDNPWHLEMGFKPLRNVPLPFFPTQYSLFRPPQTSNILFPNIEKKRTVTGIYQEKTGWIFDRMKSGGEERQ